MRSVVGWGEEAEEEDDNENDEDKLGKRRRKKKLEEQGKTKDAQTFITIIATIINTITISSF